MDKIRIKISTVNLFKSNIQSPHREKNEILKTTQTIENKLKNSINNIEFKRSAIKTKDSPLGNFSNNLK